MPTPLEDGSDGDDDSLPARHSRCADLTLETDEVVIYDQQNPSAWIQSDVAVGRDTVE